MGDLPVQVDQRKTVQLLLHSFLSFLLCLPFVQVLKTYRISTAEQTAVYILLQQERNIEGSFLLLAENIT